MSHKLKIVTSQKTAQLPFVRKTLKAFEQHGCQAENLWWQEKLDKSNSEEHWMTQWLKQAKSADVVLCFVDSSYLDSGPCCREFLCARKMQKMVVIACEDPQVLGDHDVKNDNGPIVTHFMIGGQCLLSAKGQEFNDPNNIVKEVLKKTGTGVSIRRRSSLDHTGGGTVSNYEAQANAFAEGYWINVDRKGTPFYYRNMKLNHKGELTGEQYQYKFSVPVKGQVQGSLVKWKSGGTVVQGSLQNSGSTIVDGTFEGGTFSGRHVRSVPLMFAPGKWVMTSGNGTKFHYKDMKMSANGKLTGVQYFPGTSSELKVDGTVFARTNDSLGIKWDVGRVQCEADLNHCGVKITNGTFSGGTFTGQWQQ